MMQINGTPQTDFKETEVGLIPVDWNIRRLGDIATLNLGRTPSTKEDSYWDTSDHPWVSISDLNDTRVSVTAKGVSHKAFQKVFNSTYVPSGTLLMSFKLTIGRVGILDMPALHNEAIVSFLDLDQDVERDFLGFLLRFTDFDASIDTYLKGKTLNKGKLKVFPIPVPPLPEQQRIAVVLNAIQDEIAVQDDILRELREFKRSTMERLFTYGAGDTPAETKMTEIGEIPAHWEVVELDEVADIDYGIQAAVAHMTDESIGIPILTNVNIDLEGYLDLSLLRYYPLPNKKSDKILKHGDVLFNWRSGSEKHVGKTAIFDLDDEYTFSSFILRFRIKKSVQTHFLVYFLQYQKDMGFFTKKSGQSSVNSVINASNAAKLPVAFPEDTKEQDRIVSILSDIDAKIGAEEDRKSAIQDFFRTMLQQLMTGQIRLLSDDGLEG